MPPTIRLKNASSQGVIAIPRPNLSLTETAAAWAALGCRVEPWRGHYPLRKWKGLPPLTANELAAAMARRDVQKVAIQLPPRLVALDFDRDADATLARLSAEFWLLPPPLVRTPSGGLHAYFQYVGRALRNGVNRLAELGFDGVDVFSHTGALITAAPSRRPAKEGKVAGAYVWESWQSRPPFLAPELVQALAKPPPPPMPAMPVRSFAGDLTRYAAAALRGEIQAIAHCGKGGRNAQLNKSAFVLGTLAGAGALPVKATQAALLNAAAACGLVNEDGQRAVLATIKSGFESGVATPRAVA